MTLTPSTIKYDLKCGRGSISQGEKCTKNTASNGRVALKIAAGVALAGAATYGAVKYGPESIKTNAIHQSKKLMAAPKNVVGKIRLAKIQARQKAAINPKNVPTNLKNWNPWNDSIWAEGFQP